MNEDLTPKELALIKKTARLQRISRIRRRVTITAATLAAIFSGVVLARTQTQPFSNATAQTTFAQKVIGSQDSGSTSTTTAPAPAPAPAPLTTSQS